MFLELTNFKCYKYKKFKLKDGISLIKGDNGSGKSTLLRSIIFVLYDKVKKPIRYNKSTCSVRLVIDLNQNESLDIVRNKPNKLTLKYTDKSNVDEDGEVITYNMLASEAQELINLKFGSYDIFIASSYLKKGMIHPIFESSSRSKINILRCLIFNNSGGKYSVEDYKRILDDNINDSQDVVNTTKIKLDECEKFITNMKTTIESFDDNDYMNTDIDICKKSKKELLSEKKKLTRIWDHRKSILARKVALVKELDDIKYIDTSEMTKELDELKIRYDDNKRTIIDYENKIAVYEIKVRRDKYIAQHDELSIELIKYKPCDIDEVRSKLKKINKESDIDYLTDCMDCIMGVRKIMKTNDSSTNISKSEDEINTVDNCIEIELETKKEYDNTVNRLKEIELQKQALTCPSCESKLIMKDGELKVYNKKIPKSIIKEEKFLKICKRELAILKNDISRHVNLVEFYRDLSLDEIRRMIDEKTKEKNELEEAIQSHEKYMNISDKIKKVKHDIDSLKIVVGDDYDIDKYKLEKKQLSSSNRKLKREIEERESRIKYIERNNDYMRELKTKIIDLDKEDDNNREELDTYEKTIEEYDEEIKKIDQAISMIPIFSQYNEYKNRVTKLRSKYDEANRLLQSLKFIRTKSIDSEYEQLCIILNNINITLNNILSSIFVNDNIVVEINNTKNVHNQVKYSFDTSIVFNSMELDINSLSDGQIDMLFIAMIITFNLVSGLSNMILLDECLLSLTESNRNIMIKELKQRFNDRYILLVGHFDDVTTDIDNLVNV